MLLEETEESYEKFKEFCEKHKSILVKPLSESCGKGVEIFKVTKKNIKVVLL